MKKVIGKLLLTLLLCACLFACSSNEDNAFDAGSMSSGAGGTVGGASEPAGGASEPVGGASEPVGGAGGTAGAATKGPIPARCTGDGSTVALIGDGYIALSRKIPSLLTQYSGQTYRDYSEGGTLIEAVRQQAQKAYSEGPTETLIMTGGGNDAILNTNCLISGLSNETCKSDVDKALSVLSRIFEEAETAGVKEIIFFYYPHIIYMPQFLNVLDDYAIPIAQKACESRTKLDCTFIDTRDDFGGDNSGQYLILDGINPNAEGSEIIANLVYKVMQDNCANGLEMGGKEEVTPVGGSGGQTAGQGGQAGAGTGGIAGSSGAGGVAGSAGMAGTGTGGTGGTGTSGTGGASGTGASGTGGDGGTIGPQDPACLSSLTTCKTRSTDACNAFIVPTATAFDTQVKDGITLELGPYGAIMEPNVGIGFEVAIALNDNDAACLVFANTTFMEPPALNADLMNSTGVNLRLHTVYRPACMKDGEKYPVLIWGNGTCAKPEGYGALLRYIASYGYFVFAANSRYVGFNNAMIYSLNFAFAANDDPSSPYYQRLDTAKVGAMGHSQGCTATVVAGADDRIKAVILFNMNSSASKTFLAMSGEMDISGQNAMQMASALATSRVPGAYMFFHKIPRTGNFSGHLTLMRQPERVAPAAVGWWQYILSGDTTARELFVGDNCGLCGQDADFQYDQKDLP
ncbi:MAG: hypothetical protein JXA30_21035 [Deltaproteobacteria bacterium]|nr:hypothetical protein [Deltaproteobacteria bacterium]